MVTIRDIMKDEEVHALLEASSIQMTALGYTEHSFRHCRLVSNKAGEILQQLGESEDEVELARIAGYLHDIGNAVNRAEHEQTGAVLAYGILVRKGMPYRDAARIMMAIANHDEKVGTPVSHFAAALILADKSDVHRSRVTNRDPASFDIHDRVNYAATRSSLRVDRDRREAVLDIEIETDHSPMMDYFEIFLHRMKLCRTAAEFLELTFRLVINGTHFL